MKKNNETLNNLEDLRKIIKGVPADRRDVAESLFTEIVFLEGTLNTLKDRIEKDGPILVTKRGQSNVVRENPALKAYNSSIQRYSLLFKQLVDILPEPEKETPTDPLLDFIKDGMQ